MTIDRRWKEKRWEKIEKWNKRGKRKHKNISRVETKQKYEYRREIEAEDIMDEGIEKEDCQNGIYASRRRGLKAEKRDEGKMLSKW